MRITNEMALPSMAEMQNARSVERAGEVTAVPPVAPVEETSARELAPDYDEYLSAEETPSAGIYHYEIDPEGGKKIVFDAPTEEGSPSADGVQEEHGAAAPEKAEKGTTNTDQVDAEIEHLKQREKELSRRLESAAGSQREALERQLAQIQSQIRIKDTDSYRRQHSTYMES